MNGPHNRNTYSIATNGPDGQLVRHLVKRKNQPATKVQVKWSDLSDDDTWVEYTELQKLFPEFCLEDKTSFEDGAISCIESENWLGAVRPRFVLVNAGIEHDIIGLCLILSELGLAIKDPDKAHTS
jgi:hypothetical protein